MQKLVFGGTFDPPTLSHLGIARSMLEQGIVDRVVLMPCFQNPLKRALSSPEDRLAMTMCLTEPGIEVSEYEILRPKPSYTYDTLKHLQSQYPEHELSIAIGTDNEARFSEWGHYADILKEFPVYIIPRPGYPYQGLFPQMQLLTTLPIFHDSSTEVRRRVQHGEDISHLVPVKVAEYIKSHPYMYNAKHE